MTKTLICRGIIKDNALFFSLFVFYVYSLETTISSVTTQHFNNHAKKRHTQKKTAGSLPIRRGPSKNFPAQKLAHAYYAFASYLRR